MSYLGMQYIIKMMGMSSTRSIVVCGDMVRFGQKIMQEKQKVKPKFHCNAKYLASGLVLGNTPDASILHWGYQHVGILQPTQTLKFALPPTPNPNASQWNIGVVGTQPKIFALAVYISCFLCRFHLRWVANANTVFSGIWA